MPDFGIFRGFNSKLFSDKLYAGQLPTQLGLIGSDIIGLDTDYKSVINYATTQGYTLPSASQQTLQNQLVVDLKSAGVWSDLDLFYVFATDGDEDFATINWANPNAFKCSKINSPTFTTNIGFNSDGSSSYLNTNYNPNSDSANFQLLSNSLHYYTSNNPSIARHHGTRNANDDNQILYAQNIKRHQFTGGVLSNNSNTFFSSIRNGSSTEQYIDNTLNKTVTNTPTVLPSYDYVICAYNLTGSISLGGSAEISFFALGDQISNSTMYTAWNNYYSSL